jgi:hypothetical protein
MKKQSILLLALAAAMIAWFMLGPVGDRSFRVAFRQDQPSEVSSPAGKPDGTPGQSSMASRGEQAGDASGFALPQVGRIAMPSKTEKLEWKTPAGNIPIQLRVFRDANGKFVRAEYKNISKEKIRLDAVERGLKASSEQIHGLARNPPKIEFQTLFDRFTLNEPFEEISGMTVTYVGYSFLREKDPARARRDLFILNVWGLDHFDRGHLGENFKCVRFLVESDGTLFRADDRL